MPKMLVTRPEPDARDTIARLAALGIEGVAAPLLERAALHGSLPDAREFSALALTSANALRALQERGALAPYLDLKVFAVGDRTAAAAREAGFADVVSAGGTLARLVATIGAVGLGGPVFYPAAQHQSADLEQALSPLGIRAVTARVYEMRAASVMPPPILDALGRNEFAAALFYSRRTAEIFVSRTAGHLDAGARKRLGMLCLSEQVAAPLIAAHFVRATLAAQPNEAGMMALALAFVRDRNTA